LPRKFSRFIQEKVRRRANFLCEYCHTDERWQLVQFTIDHIIPISEGGTGELENLALACFHCNRKKSDKQSVSDSQTNSIIPLFNPQKMLWNEHFIWSEDGLRIISLTEIGRVTIELLKLNRERILQIRQDDILVNRHPPRNDTIQTSK
jgi:5-methylcytosine-specific restriction endonuclease McrA